MKKHRQVSHCPIFRQEGWLICNFNPLQGKENSRMTDNVGLFLIWYASSKKICVHWNMKPKRENLHTSFVCHGVIEGNKTFSSWRQRPHAARPSSLDWKEDLLWHYFDWKTKNWGKSSTFLSNQYAIWICCERNCKCWLPTVIVMKLLLWLHNSNASAISICPTRHLHKILLPLIMQFCGALISNI